MAYLRKFRIGDIWEDGINTGRRDTSTRETFQLDIAEGTAQVMPVGVPINSDRQNPEYPLPFSAFGSHRDHTHAQCVRIQLDDNSTFVVPCMELVRFYFGASGSFLKRLFSGAFALDKLYTRARLNQKTYTANIDLAPNLSGVAAATVARIALDRQARSAARWIVNSGTATSANVVSYYPKTTFPFYGATDLTVYGRWIIQGDRRVFFAEQLVRCTHPFPFFTLYYTTCMSLMKRGEMASASGRDPDKMPANMPEPAFPTTHLTEQSVSSVLQPVGISIDDESEVPFPDLAAKKVRRVKESKEHVQFSDFKDPIEELSIGDENSSSPTRAAEVSAELPEVAIEEVQPDAVDAFAFAISANNGFKPGHMTWVSLVGDHSNAGKPPEAFVRGDAVVKSGDERLQNIWCGLIEVRRGPILSTLLVLIRDNVTEDVHDHVLMLRIDPSIIERDDIEKYCVAFAAGGQSEVYSQNIVDMIGSQSASKLSMILIRLSNMGSRLTIYSRNVGEWPSDAVIDRGPSGAPENFTTWPPPFERTSRKK